MGFCPAWVGTVRYELEYFILGVFSEVDWRYVGIVLAEAGSSALLYIVRHSGYRG